MLPSTLTFRLLASMVVGVALVGQIQAQVKPDDYTVRAVDSGRYLGTDGYYLVLRKEYTDDCGLTLPTPQVPYVNFVRPNAWISANPLPVHINIGNMSDPIFTTTVTPDDPPALFSSMEEGMQANAEPGRITIPGKGCLIHTSRNRVDVGSCRGHEALWKFEALS
ncbi:MAG: hypothetical protein DHS80DRAFT_25592 [Piptocephalis tieghemiana]|nr:MAG: hypothetical protein DHS80DRAFT_25592 [Piptocephalis tieghemiana]